VKAWITELYGTKSLVMAETRSKALWQAIKSARDAGYDVAVDDVDSVRRVPCFDNCGLQPGRCHSIEAAWDSYCRAVARRSS
jgi:hypothetical protein